MTPTPPGVLDWNGPGARGGLGYKGRTMGNEGIMRAAGACREPLDEAFLDGLVLDGFVSEEDAENALLTIELVLDFARRGDISVRFANQILRRLAEETAMVTADAILSGG